MVFMKKESLQYILKTLARILENSAEKTYIEEFKAKYKGMRWNDGIERSLLGYAHNGLTMKRWIENLIDFMIEKNISFRI
jgi:hypothetical protein